MSSSLALVALAALFPAMTGPAPMPQQNGPLLTLALCNGGTIALGVVGEGKLPSGLTPCCAKGCQSGRKKSGKNAGA